MADKKITLYLRLKNTMAAGFAKAKKGIVSLSKTASRAAKQMAASFAAAGAAVVAFAAVTLKAHGKQVEAEKALTAALNARGEAGRKLLPLLKRQAAAIQDETGAADEQTLATMAQLSTLGVATSKLKEAAKATVALKSVGLEGASAQRAVALAMQGNYEMLNRYVPAIRNATTEQEKAAAANDLFVRGYEQQKELLDTLPGQWRNLTGRIGDAAEEAGRAISEESGLTGIVKKLADKIKELTESGRIQVWAENVKTAVSGLRPVVDGLASGFDKIKTKVQTIGGKIGARIGKRQEEAADKAGDVEFKISDEQRIKNQMRRLRMEQEAERLGVTLPERRRGPVSAEVTQEQLDAIAEATARIIAEDEKARREEIAQARKSKEAAEAAAEEETEAELKAGDAKAEAIARAQAIIDAARTAANKVATATAEIGFKAREAQREKHEKRMAAIEKRAIDAQKKAAQDKLQAARDEIAKREQLAKMRVADFIAAAKKEKDLAKEQADEEKRMRRLEEKARKPGLKLSKEDQARLDAWRKIQEARAGIGAAGLKAQAAKDELAAINAKQLQALEAIEIASVGTNKKLTNLLAMG
jgi:hypothetical protein